MKRIVLELFREERWRLVGGAGEQDGPGSLTLQPGVTITFGFLAGRAVVYSAQARVVTPEIQVVNLDPFEPLAVLDDGPYETSVIRQGEAARIRLRLEET